MATTNLQEPSQLPAFRVDSSNASLLPLVHPLIRQNEFCPDICVTVNSESHDRPKIASISSNPQAFLNGKVYAWSSNQSLSAQVFKQALNWDRDGVLVRIGRKANFCTEGDVVVLEASNEAEAELFVEILATPGISVSQALLRSMISSVRSTTALVITEALQKKADTDKEVIPVEIRPFSTPSLVTETISADDLIEQMVRSIANPSIKNGLWFVHLLNLNGLSQLEMYTLAGSVSKVFSLGQSANPHISWSFFSDQETKQKGLSLAVLNLENSLFPEYRAAGLKVNKHKQHFDHESTERQTLKTNPRLALPPSDNIAEMIEKGCRSIISAEPQITEYDVLTGDGDCGYTLSAGALCVLEKLPLLDFSNLAAALDALSETLQTSMGGTSGALYCIFISSLSYQLTKDCHLSFITAMKAAYEELLTFTRARPGDRTCIDALAPFVSALASGDSLKAAAGAAESGAQQTKSMVPKMGRSTYLAEHDCLGVPDPGAWALAALLRGICTA